jgi:hypothetical protein
MSIRRLWRTNMIIASLPRYDDDAHTVVMRSQSVYRMLKDIFQEETEDKRLAECIIEWLENTSVQPGEA